VVSREEDDSVWFTMTAFSRPNIWYTRLGGPLVPLAQRAYGRLLAAGLRRLSQPHNRP